MSTLEKPPGPRGWPLFGNAIDLWRQGSLPFVAQGAEIYGELVRFQFGPTLEYLLVSGAADAQRVLQKNNQNYIKGRGYNGLRLVLGNGLVTSEGELWRRQRRLAQPAFHRERLDGFVTSMARCTEEMMRTWRAPAAGDEQQIDLHEHMTKLTLRIVIEALFGTAAHVDPARITLHVPVVLEHAARTARAEFMLPAWVPTASRRRFRESLRALDEVTYEMIAERRANRGGSSMLDMFMDAVDEEDAGMMNDQQLRDEVITMIGAGHETTASTLSFVWHLLTHHRAVLERLQREVDGVLGDRAPTLADLSRLAYTEQVILETLRLYPAAWNMERQAIADDELSGYRVRAGTTVMICPYTLHRNPRLWPDPERFDPDRFLPERREARGSYDYIPFSAGPRMCIGKQFAMMEAKVVLAMLVRRFELTSLHPEPLPLTSDVTLRPAGGLPCRLLARAN